MTVNLRLSNNKDVVYIECEGSVTAEDIKNSVTRLYSEKDIHLQKYQIIDLSKCASADILSSDVKDVVLMHKEGLVLSSKLKVGMIAPSDFLFGMSRIYKAYAESIGLEVLIFRDKEKCYLWLENQLKQS